MESKPLSKKISKAKNKVEQNYQHTNKTQCPNEDTLKIANVYIIVVVGVGFLFFIFTTYRR